VFVLVISGTVFQVIIMSTNDPELMLTCMNARNDLEEVHKILEDMVASLLKFSNEKDEEMPSRYPYYLRMIARNLLHYVKSALRSIDDITG